MSVHDAFQELAATALDFELTASERAELDRHLAGCDHCRRTVAGYENDAVAIGAGPAPRLPAERAALILERALRPPKRSSSVRLLAVAALLTVLGGGMIAAGIGIARLTQDPTLAVVPTPRLTPEVSSGPSPQPSTSTPAASATPTAPANVGSLPIAGSGSAVGTGIRMAPGTGGDLYVAIPSGGGTVVTRLDARGASHDGWPVTLDKMAACDRLLPADDGTVRVLCAEDQSISPSPPIHAFALDPSGRILPGWPVHLVDHGVEAYLDGRVIGEILAVFVRGPEVAGPPGEEPPGRFAMVAIAADGTVRIGAKFNPLGTGPEHFAIGPDGVAYGIFAQSNGDPFQPTWSSQLYPWGFSGEGFGATNVIIEGVASRPAFDAAGQIRMVVATEPGGPARLVSFDPRGVNVYRELDVGFVAMPRCLGVEGTCLEPAAPVVGSDGTAIVLAGGGTGTIAAVSADYFDVKDGWPYQSRLAHQTVGVCPTGSVCDSGILAAPALGPDNVLYLIQATAQDAEGGGLVAVGVDGRVVDGWPVGLKRKGSAFWSVVVGADRTVYALAVEPEVDDGSSATIVALKPDSTVHYRTTIIDP